MRSRFGASWPASGVPAVAYSRDRASQGGGRPSMAPSGTRGKSVPAARRRTSLCADGPGRGHRRASAAFEVRRAANGRAHARSRPRCARHPRAGRVARLGDARPVRRRSNERPAQRAVYLRPRCCVGRRLDARTPCDALERHDDLQAVPRRSGLSAPRRRGPFARPSPHRDVRRRAAGTLFRRVSRRALYDSVRSAYAMRSIHAVEQ